MILSAGDSYATFNTHDCNNLENILLDHHAVQLVAKRFDVDAFNVGIPGAGIQDSVVNTLFKLNNMSGIGLIFFHITQISRFPVDNRSRLECKLDGLEDYKSIEDLQPPEGINNVIDKSRDYTNYISLVPPFKFQFDDIAYLALLIQVCKLRNINIIFVSEFVAHSTAWKDLSLFASEPHVKICDSFLCNNAGLDKSEHHFDQIKGNHLCQHYQEYLANEYLERYSEFIKDSLL